MQVSSAEYLKYEEEAKKHLQPFMKAYNKKAMLEIYKTLAGVVACLVLMPFLPIPISLIFGAFCVRFFVIFHDCGHVSYFDTVKENEFWGKFISCIIMTPYPRWRWRHNYHHTNFGKIGIVDYGQTIVYTKDEYNALPLLKKAAWRVIRIPVVFFFGIPIVKWGIDYPFLRGDRYTTVALVWISLYSYYVTPWILLGIYFGGFWGLQLFHIQHSIEKGYREFQDKWSFFEACFKGSSYAPIPSPLSFFTFGIEFHHIHHYSPRVPSYKLRDCHFANLPLWEKLGVQTVTFDKYIQCLSHVLYDKTGESFISEF